MQSSRLLKKQNDKSRLFFFFLLFFDSKTDASNRLSHAARKKYVTNKYIHIYMCVNMRDSGPTRHAAPFTCAHITYSTLYTCASRYPQHSETSLRQKIITPTTIFPSLIPFFQTIFPSTIIYRSLLSEYVQSFYCYNYIVAVVFYRYCYYYYYCLHYYYY